MFTKKDLEMKYFFEDVAAEWLRLNDGISNIHEQFYKVFGTVIGEVGQAAIEKWFSLFEERLKIEYIIERDGYSYDDIFKFWKEELRESQKAA